MRTTRSPDVPYSVNTLEYRGRVSMIRRIGCLWANQSYWLNTSLPGQGGKERVKVREKKKKNQQTNLGEKSIKTGYCESSSYLAAAASSTVSDRSKRTLLSQTVSKEPPLSTWRIPGSQRLVIALSTENVCWLLFSGKVWWWLKAWWSVEMIVFLSTHPGRSRPIQLPAVPVRGLFWVFGLGKTEWIVLFG